MSVPASSGNNSVGKYNEFPQYFSQRKKYNAIIIRDLVHTIGSLRTTFMDYGIVYQEIKERNNWLEQELSKGKELEKQYEDKIRECFSRIVNLERQLNPQVDRVGESWTF